MYRRQVSMESSARKRRRENQIVKEEIAESNRPDMTSTYTDDNEDEDVKPARDAAVVQAEKKAATMAAKEFHGSRWSPPPYPHVIRRDRFCITRQDFHKVYGLSLDGHDPKTFSRDAISPSDWLSVFTEPHVKDKVKVRSVVPALYRELMVLYQKVYQEPPGNRVSVAFARGFAFENCKSSLEATNKSYFKVAWAVVAEGSVELVRKYGRLERKRKKWMGVRYGVQHDPGAKSPALSCSPSCDLPQQHQWDGTVPATPATEEGDGILTPPVANLVPTTPATEEGDIILTPPVANLVPSTSSSGVSPPPRPTSPVPEVPSSDLASPVPEVPPSDPPTTSSQSDHSIPAQTFVGLQWCEFIKHPDLPHDLAKEVQVVERCSDLLGSGWAGVRQAMEPLDCSKLETIFATILKLRSSLNAGIRIMQMYENDVMNELKKIVIRQAEEIRQQEIAARQKEQETEQRLEEAKRQLASEQQMYEKLLQMMKERLKAWSTELITSWDNVVRGYR